jgi:hypothetical protein
MLISIFGISAFIVLLFPHGRKLFIDLVESFVFNKKLSATFIVQAENALKSVALSGICFIIFLDFWMLTVPGKLLLHKIGFFNIDKAEVRGFIKLHLITKIYEKRFELFVFINGFFALIISVSRATNTGLTYDEAYTYLHGVYPSFLYSIIGFQSLNNHILNTFMIRVICFITQTRFNELFIRLPNLISYGVYIFFCFRIAKKTNHRYFIFVLFITNYYLNEFFGLARGYGMAAACITAAFYYFEEWKVSLPRGSGYFHYFMVWCSLAALANGISLYAIFSVLILIVLKYHKNIIKLSNCLYFLIFFFVAMFIFLSSGEGLPLMATNNFYECIIVSVFGTFSLSISFLPIVLFIIFFGCLCTVLIKAKFSTDYVWIYIIFFCVCLVSNIVFSRGYPYAREMIPFYPIVVLIIADVLKITNSTKSKNILIFTIGCLLYFQFILQINTKSTADWNDDYRIREDMVSYAFFTHKVGNFDEAFSGFINEYHPVVVFYVEKYKMFLTRKEESN